MLLVPLFPLLDVFHQHFLIDPAPMLEPLSHKETPGFAGAADKFSRGNHLIQSIIASKHRT